MEKCKVTGKYYPSIDKHHVIPKEYGGKEEGTTINLGPDIHQTIHRCASNPKMKDEFLSSLSQSGKKTALYLINAIREAKSFSEKRGEVKTDHKVTVTIPDKIYKKLEILSKDLGLTIPDIINMYLRKVVSWKV